MASEKVTAMIEEVKALTVLELSELVHALEELGGSALLLGDLLEHAGQAGNGGQHGAQDLGLEHGQRGNGGQGHHLVQRHDPVFRFWTHLGRTGRRRRHIPRKF